MNWAPTILRIRDISIKMHVTFLLLLAFEAWIWSTHGITGIAFGVGLTILLFTCVVLHELGHAFAARTVGIPVREILLLPIGGIAYLSRAPKTPRDELWIAVAGPLVNVIIALCLLPFVGASASFVNFPGPESAPSISLLLTGLYSANVMLVLFNLLPAFPLDGGRILRAGLAMLLSERTATTYATVISQGVAAVIGTIAVMSGQIFLAITALFIFFSAGSERGESRARSLLESRLVGDAYNRMAVTLSPADRTSRVVDLILTSYQPDFAVVQGNTLLGIVTRRHVLEALAAEPADQYVAAIMNRDFVRVAHTMSLDEVRSSIGAASDDVAAVFSGKEFLGLVSLVDIDEALAVIDYVDRNKSLHPGA
jgi:Zn-dependent protease